MQINIPEEKIKTRKTDNRGRISLTSKYKNQKLRIAILDQDLKPYETQVKTTPTIKEHEIEKKTLIETKTKNNKKIRTNIDKKTKQLRKPIKLKEIEQNDYLIISLKTLLSLNQKKKNIILKDVFQGKKILILTDDLSKTPEKITTSLNKVIFYRPK